MAPPKKYGDVYCYGIYQITNKKNGKFYIGSTIVTFKRRWAQHHAELKKNYHKNIHLQRSYDKHGFSSFEFSIVEFCTNKDMVIEREQYYIDTLKPSYNLSLVASRPAYYVQSEEQRRKTSERFKGKPSWNDGLKFGEETRQRMSESKKGLKTNRTYIKGTNDKPVIRSDGKIFKNPTLAAEELGVKANTIVKAISDKTMIRKVKGFTFKYQNETIENIDKNITKSGRKWIVTIKSIYYETFETIEEARTFRDNKLKELLK